MANLCCHFDDPNSKDEFQWACCDNNCPPGFYFGQSKPSNVSCPTKPTGCSHLLICEKCHSSCRKCFDGNAPDLCRECRKDFFRLDLKNCSKSSETRTLLSDLGHNPGLAERTCCVEKCPSGFFANATSKSCEPCSAKCGECDGGSRAQCIKCMPEHFKKPVQPPPGNSTQPNRYWKNDLERRSKVTDGKVGVDSKKEFDCVKDCGDTMYGNSTSGHCETCDEQCVLPPGSYKGPHCFGFGPNKCKFCRTVYIEQTETCATACPSGLTQDTKKMEHSWKGTCVDEGIGSGLYVIIAGVALLVFLLVGYVVYRKKNRKGRKKSVESQIADAFTKGSQNMNLAVPQWDGIIRKPSTIGYIDASYLNPIEDPRDQNSSKHYFSISKSSTSEPYTLNEPSCPPPYEQTPPIPARKPIPEPGPRFVFPPVDPLLNRDTPGTQCRSPDNKTVVIIHSNNSSCEEESDEEIPIYEDVGRRYSDNSQEGDVFHSSLIGSPGLVDEHWFESDSLESVYSRIYDRRMSHHQSLRSLKQKPESPGVPVTRSSSLKLANGRDQQYRGRYNSLPIVSPRKSFAQRKYPLEKTGSCESISSKSGFYPGSTKPGDRLGMLRMSVKRERFNSLPLVREESRDGSQAEKYESFHSLALQPQQNDLSEPCYSNSSFFLAKCENGMSNSSDVATDNKPQIPDRLSCIFKASNVPNYSDQQPLSTTSDNKVDLKSKNESNVEGPPKIPPRLSKRKTLQNPLLLAVSGSSCGDLSSDCESTSKVSEGEGTPKVPPRKGGRNKGKRSSLQTEGVGNGVHRERFNSLPSGLRNCLKSNDSVSILIPPEIVKAEGSSNNEDPNIKVPGNNEIYCDMSSNALIESPQNSIVIEQEANESRETETVNSNDKVGLVIYSDEKKSMIDIEGVIGHISQVEDTANVTGEESNEKSVEENVEDKGIAIDNIEGEELGVGNEEVQNKKGATSNNEEEEKVNERKALEKENQSNNRQSETENETEEEVERENREDNKEEKRAETVEDNAEDGNLVYGMGVFQETERVLENGDNGAVDEIRTTTEVEGVGSRYLVETPVLNESCERDRSAVVSKGPHNEEEPKKVRVKKYSKKRYRSLPLPIEDGNGKGNLNNCKSESASSLPPRSRRRLSRSKANANNVPKGNMSGQCSEQSRKHEKPNAGSSFSSTEDVSHRSKNKNESVIVPADLHNGNVSKDGMSEKLMHLATTGLDSDINKHCVANGNLDHVGVYDDIGCLRQK